MFDAGGSPDPEPYLNSARMPQPYASAPALVAALKAVIADYVALEQQAARNIWASYREPPSVTAAKAVLDQAASRRNA